MLSTLFSADWSFTWNHLFYFSEQCLGQYKMNMFCQEARAQLALLPDALKKIMSGQSNAVATKSAELWLAHQHAQISEQLRKEDKNKNEALALNLNLKGEGQTKQPTASENGKTQKRSASPSYETYTDRIHPRKKPMVKVDLTLSGAFHRQLMWLMSLQYF